MTQPHSYLTFNGNCHEAMNFYKECLDVELSLLQTIGESPLSEKMPVKMKECILHTTLIEGALLLMGSDMTPESGLVKGNSISLSLSCSSEDELRAYYTKLSKDGTIEHLIENSFWGALFGDLTDKYGIYWLLHFDKNQINY